MSTPIISNSPISVNFYDRDKTYTPKEVFEIFYCGLDGLISEVSEKILQSKKFDEPDNIRRERVNKQYIIPWSSSIRQLRTENPIKAEITFENGSKKDYELVERTNFRLTNLKRPSILYLRDDNGEEHILREARTYPVEGAIKGLFSIAGYTTPSFAFVASKQWLEQDKDNEVIWPKGKKQALYIPEPNLILALEKIYNEFPDLPRITPRQRVVDANETTLWYIRDKNPLYQDSGMEPELLGNHLAILSALGLVDKIDNKLEHYSRYGKILLNYDPDFITFLNNPQHSLLGNYETTFEVLSDSYNADVINNEDFKKRMKKASNTTLDTLIKKGITPELFKSNIERRINPTWKLLQ